MFDPTWGQNILEKFQDIVHELQLCGQLINLCLFVLSCILGTLWITNFLLIAILYHKRKALKQPKSEYQFVD